MKISRMADEHTIPSWALKNDKADEIERTRKILARELKHFNCASVSREGVTEDALTLECDRIDQCAESGETYYYPTDWNDEHVSHLKEYAKVAGLNESNLVGLDTPSVMEALASIEDDTEIHLASNESAMTKTASSNADNEITLDDFRFDPFKLDALLNKEASKPDVWETVGRQSDLTNKPSMYASVRAIRGGEDTSISNRPSLAENQNSINNPDAIKEMVESDIPDTGARLAAEKAAREQLKSDEHTAWKQNKIEAMSKQLMPSGRVFPTESLNAQSGIKSSIMAAHSTFDPEKDLPAQTEGEMIKEKNASRKQSIQREEVADNDWDSAKQQSSFGISDTFAESLKKHLRK